MDIDFELYKVFYYVARHLSFSEASKQLYISQSAVSQSVAVLEEKLGCRLLFRNTKRVRLTREGAILFEYIEQAFNFIKAAEKNIDEIHSLVKGDIRIGASDTICKHYLLPYIKRFTEMYPGIKIHITNRPSPRCVELLKKGSVDFSVINIPGKLILQGMDIKEVKTIQDVFVAGKNFSHLRGRQLCLKDLESYPIMALEENSTTRQFLDTFLDKNNVNITPEIELGSIDLLVELAKIGLGISYVMEDSVRREVESGELFVLNIREGIPERKLGIITLASPPPPAAAVRFIELMEG